jgi:hypothetical protein
MFHQTKVAEKNTTRVLCLIPLPENHAVYEKKKKNVEPGRLHVTIWRMRIACWITQGYALRMCNTSLFHGVNGCMNSPQFIVCLVENYDSQQVNKKGKRNSVQARAGPDGSSR